MREYGKILTTIWTESKKFASLKGNDTARYLYLYLHTCPHVNSIGCFVLPMGYACCDLGWDEDKIKSTLKDLSIAHLMEFGEEGVVKITNFLTKTPITNPKHFIGAAKLATALPDCKEKDSIIRELQGDKYCPEGHPILEHTPNLDRAQDTPMDTTEPETEPETDREEEKGTSYPKENEPTIISSPSDEDEEIKPEPEDLLDIPDFLKRKSKGTSIAVIPEPSLGEMFDEFWAAYPRRIGKAPAKGKFKDALKKASFKEIMAGVHRYAAATAETEAKFIIYPERWLKKQRWLDEPDKAAPRGKQDVMGAFDKLREQVRVQ